MGKDKTPARIDPETTRAKAAEKHLKKKVVLPVFDTRQMTAYHHSVAFMVAKMANASQLQFLKEQVEKAQKEGLSFDQFAKNIEGQIPLSRARKALIFDTNLRSARAAGRWQAIEDTKELLPFLEYGPSDAGKPRDSHKHYYGVILPTDHDFWKTHFPPNGYGCRCKTYRLTRAQAQRKGGPSKDFEFNDDDVQESFRHNHTRRLEALADLAEKRFGAAFAQRLKQETLALYEAEAAKDSGYVNDEIKGKFYKPPKGKKGDIEAQAEHFVITRGQRDGIEYGVAIDEKNRVVDIRRGTTGAVNYEDLSEKMENFRIIHNHPSNGPLSYQDVRLALEEKLKSIKAVGTYEKSSYNMEVLDADEGLNLLLQDEKWVNGKATSLYLDNKVDTREANIMRVLMLIKLLEKHNLVKHYMEADSKTSALLKRLAEDMKKFEEEL